MKPVLLSVSILLALNLAHAAEPATRAAPAAAPAAASTARAPLDPAQAQAAREELDELRAQIGELSRRMADLSLELGDVGPRAFAFRYLADPDRALVGIVLGADARIDALTPDGPAERAGLRSGDRITRINGAALDGKDARANLAEARKRLADLKEGDEVRIGYSRDGKPGGEVTVKAQRREALNWPTMLAGNPGERELLVERLRIDPQVREEIRDAREVARNARIDAERARSQAGRSAITAEHARDRAEQARHRAEVLRIDSLRHAMPWWGISLAALNPDLGRYFGTDSGVLVLSASADTLPDLEAGDVIRKVDGKAVARPEDALRALRDPPAGSTVKVDVLRQRKARVLEIKVPEHKTIFSMGRFPAPAAPPVPPTPPVAPTAPVPALPDTPVPPIAPLPPVAGPEDLALAAGRHPHSAMG